MFRSLFILSNLIFSLILNVIFGEGVKVTQKAPDRVDPGSEFVVELIINKSDVTGFAKIQQDLPKGFEAEAIETQGASFTFNDNKIKLIWMSLPESDEFSIKYKVKVGPEVEGKQIVTGKFSYLHQNERKVVDLPISEIMVGEEEIVETVVPEEKTEDPETAEQVEETPEETETPEEISEEPTAPEATEQTPEVTEQAVEEPETIEEPVAEEPVEQIQDETEVTEVIEEAPQETEIPEEVTEEPGAQQETVETETEKPVAESTIEKEPETAPESAIQTPPAKAPQVSATRNITDLGNGQYKIAITIKQKGVSGFAKVQERLPDGVTAAQGKDTEHAVFSFVDNQAKFVWMSLPEDSEINISYLVTAQDLSLEDFNNMEGNFAFLFNEETMKVDITPFSEKPSETPVAKEEEEEVIVEEIPKDEPETPIAEPDKTAVAVSKEPTSVIPAPETGVFYKVQICAGHKPVTVESYFKSTFNFSEGPISVENHEGWIKYTIDKFNIYKAARDRRNEVTAGYTLPGPFVTAYNDGVRITVQEALMITNQKWVQ